MTDGQLARAPKRIGGMSPKWCDFHVSWAFHLPSIVTPASIKAQVQLSRLFVHDSKIK
jgi:hypothetical protein